MPHVVVKMHSGKTDQQKTAIVAEITKALMTAINSSDASISVSLEEFAPSDWAEKVVKPEIIGKPDTLYKRPGNLPA